MHVFRETQVWNAHSFWTLHSKYEYWILLCGKSCLSQMLDCVNVWIVLLYFNGCIFNLKDCLENNADNEQKCKKKKNSYGIRMKKKRPLFFPYIICSLISFVHVCTFVHLHSMYQNYSNKRSHTTNSFWLYAIFRLLFPFYKKQKNGHGKRKKFFNTGDMLFYMAQTMYIILYIACSCVSMNDTYKIQFYKFGPRRNKNVLAIQIQIKMKRNFFSKFTCPVCLIGVKEKTITK